MKHIAHLTTAHTRIDTRIFLKECCSLVEAGFKVTLVVADGKGNQIKEGVQIRDVGSFQDGRINRLRNGTRSVFDEASKIDADLYHLHDPELIPAGLKLKRLGKRVIFDAHEDLPKQMLGKPYLNKPLLWILSQCLTVYETWACAKFDAIIAATPFIREKFIKINPKTIDINNFPLLHELENISSWSEKSEEVCYVGGITKIRGIHEVCASLSLMTTRVKLNLVGSFSDSKTEKNVKSMPGWQKVNELGFIDRDGVRTVLSRSRAGLVTFHPLPNHIDAQPNKMFEYMSAGIPVIASDFPLWREIIERNNCGILVDPLDPARIAHAIDYLISNPNDAERMGKNGRSSVMERYNWEIEKKKLFNIYNQILS
jgi:glycosyltransferase involved in cell wall biosynthesis